MKAQLKELLGEKLLARGVSARYPTSGSKVIVDELIASSGKPYYFPFNLIREVS